MAVRVAVVGGGVCGLAAAHRLRVLLGPGAELDLHEARPAPGGTLASGPLGDRDVELGAEAFVVRRPEVLALVAELGLTADLVWPSALRPLVWAGGRAHPLPEGTLTGVPADAESVRGLVDAAVLDRIRAEPARPFHWVPGGDMSVHDLVADRFGEQVVARSVDPLLGGVYAGDSRGIGVRAALPALARALDAGAGSLTAAVRAALPPAQPGPVFGALRGGYRQLVEALRVAGGARVLTGSTVTALTRTARGWDVGGGRYDGVVLAVPAHAAAALLAGAAPQAAAAAADITFADSALVALRLPDGTGLPPHSGVLVATGEALAAKAFTFTSRKWPHQGDRVLLRASFGRSGAPATATDAQLVHLALADLEAVAGVRAQPVAARVQWWRRGLPQYAPGHTGRVAAIRAAVAQVPGLAVAGNYLDGVGVPACVGAADAAARRLAGQLA